MNANIDVKDNRIKYGKDSHFYKHGMARVHPLYNVWASMIFDGPTAKKSGRGGCCNEWKDFNVFYAWAVSRYRKGLVLVRFDPDKPHSPSNTSFETRNIKSIYQKRKVGKSGYIGIKECFYKGNHYGWQATLSYDRVQYHCGFSRSLKEAVILRNDFIAKNKFPNKIQEYRND